MLIPINYNKQKETFAPQTSSFANVFGIRFRRFVEA
jgi:hypothetical protein